MAATVAADALPPQMNRLRIPLDPEAHISPVTEGAGR
jgi:hypothetical protein